MSSDDLNENTHVFKNRKRVYTEEVNKPKNFLTEEKFEIESESLDKKVKYPKIVFLIILNEFCERFSYYGIRTVLFIYLTSFIKLDQNTATAIYHAFTVVCYFTPVFGAIVADGYLGLYKTILYVSIVYSIGEIILTLTSMIPLGAPNMAGPAVALIIIAIGTGGIKPCVSAFGGNQFNPNQKKYLETFFSVFYLSINIGSTIGTILTPIFRSDVKCFGEDCYPLAFGIPALFMITAIIFFFIGTPFYNRDDEKSKKGQNVITKTIGCFYEAIKNKIKFSKTEKRDHWLDYADKKYSAEMIYDVKAFFGVFKVFLPLPIFWALYDQQGSRWTAQAQQLSGIVGQVTIKPDQFQAINPVFIVLLVPLFDFVIYPLLGKFNLLQKQLQRMGVGLIFAIASFVIAAILESQMQKSSLILNPNDRIRIINLSPCNISFYHSLDNNLNNTQAIFGTDQSIYLNNKPNDLPKSLLEIIKKSNQTNFQLKSVCKNRDRLLISNLVIDSTDLPKNVFLYLDNNEIKSVVSAYNNQNQLIGVSELKISTFNIDEKFGKFYTNLFNNKIRYDSSKFVLTDIKSLNNSNVQYSSIDYAQYSFTVQRDDSLNLLNENILTETCGRYSIVLFHNKNFNETKLDYIVLTDIYPNGLHIGWQIIQIFVMSVGEVMFSISGISFAYSQAPISMKSVIQALWCLTVAFGNLVVVIVAEAKFVNNQVYEYLLFAGLLTLATAAFITLSWFYKYREINDEKSDSDNKETNKNSNLNSVGHTYSADSEIQIASIAALDSN